MGRFRVAVDNPPLQHILYEASGDPWRVAAACMLLARTRRAQVDAVWPRLFSRWPDAPAMADAAWPDLEDLLAPLGFGTRRGALLRAMGASWAADPGPPVERHPGLGWYARDAHEIFVEHRLDVRSADYVLDGWVRLLRALAPEDRPAGYRGPATATAGR